MARRALLTGLTIALLLLPAVVRGEVELGLRSRLGAGYNSSIYLDAASLPAEGDEVAAPLLSVAPALQVQLGRSHRLAVSWQGRWHEHLGTRESMLEHRAALGYTTPPLARFRFTLLGAMDQLYVREAAGMGRIGGFGGLQVQRPLGYSVRACLRYLVDHDRYADGAAAEWELAHRVSAGLTVRLAPGLTATPGYTLSLVDARPDELSSVQHLGELRLHWDLPWIPLELGAGYGLTGLLLEGSGGGVPGTGRPARRTDLLHGVQVEAVVLLTDWLGLYAVYDGILGFSNQEPERYARHSASGGVLLRWSIRSRDETRLRSGPRRLRLELHAPRARRVAAVGDFNGWDPKSHPLRHEGTMWRTDLQLDPGRHPVMLWVDGDLRVPPGCTSVIPDGFGGATCVVTVDR